MGTRGLSFGGDWLYKHLEAAVVLLKKRLHSLQGDLPRWVAELHKDNCTSAASFPGNSMDISCKN